MCLDDKQQPNKSSDKKKNYQKRMRKLSPLPLETFIVPLSITGNHIPTTDFTFPPGITSR